MINEFLKVKVRENSGSTSSSRFDYQKDWSICQLLETHHKQSDYLFIFDYHDDLIVMDSESDPGKISFYQIKGKKSGRWSLNDIIKSELSKDKKTYLLSIIGKLYSHKLNFSDKVESVNFISNARFNVQLAAKEGSDSKDSICIIELSAEAKQKIHEKLKNEHSLTLDDTAFESISFLKVVELSLTDSATHTTGKLANFLHNRDAKKKYNVPLIYKVLFDEVKRRTAYSKEITDLTSLLENKALSKRKFDEILDKIGVDKDFDEIWKGVQTALSNEGVLYSTVINYKKQWDRLQLARMSYNNDVLLRVLDDIEVVTSQKEKGNKFGGMTLMQMVDEVYSSLNAESKSSPYDEIFIRTAIISHLHE